MLNNLGERIPPCMTPFLRYKILPYIIRLDCAYSHFMVLINSYEYPFVCISSNSLACGTESNA